jgi:hypothetical protein
MAKAVGGPVLERGKLLVNCWLLLGFGRWDHVLGGLEHVLFPYIGNVIIPTDELIFFRGVQTTNQVTISQQCELKTNQWRASVENMSRSDPW